MHLPTSNDHTIPFDHLAAGYDKAFTHSLTGAEQRRQTRYWLLQVIGHTPLDILEMNCGTGEDACWLADIGHRVTATDQSAGMVYQAEKKLTLLHQTTLTFQACELLQLGQQFANRQFDLLFSNFAGLNCIAPAELPALAKQINQLLKPGGHFAVVVFGKYTLWESLYHLLKMQPGKAFRRWGHQEVLVPLHRDITQPVYYYPIRQLARQFSPLQLICKKPVGLFVPPSYLEGAMQQRPGLFRLLCKLDNHIALRGYLPSLADHSFLLFKKNAP